MTKKEAIYNALGMIEGAVCVSQKNTREVLMKAIQIIKDAIEEDAEQEPEIGCVHKWELKETYQYASDEFEMPKHRAKFICRYCGAIDMRDI